MARPTNKVNHIKMDDNMYHSKYDESVSNMTTKFAEQVEFEIGSKSQYIGGIHEKNSICTITKVVNKKGKVYYSVIFDGTDREINFILSKVLKKIDVVVENDNNINIESEEISNGM